MLGLDAKSLCRRSIELKEPPKINTAEMLRSLLPVEREYLMASPEELAARNPLRLLQFLRLDEWYHPDLANEQLPGQCSTFKMLAAAIAENNLSHYKPINRSNTHWLNWPEGGKL